MKKIFVAVFLLISYLGFGQTEADSLWNIVNDPRYSDSLKLEAYEKISKDLLKTDPDSCRIVCREALDFSEQVGNSRFLWSFYNRIGAAYRLEGNTEQTIEYFMQSLEIAEMARDTFTIAQTLSNIGIVYDDDLGDLNKALEYYLKSIQYKKQLNDEEKDYYSIAMTQMYAGLVYLKQKKWDKATEIFNEAQAFTQLIQENDKKYIVYFNLGLFSAYFGSHQDNRRMVYEGIKYYLLAEEVIKNSGNKINYGKTLANIADAYFYVGETDFAKANMKKAEAIAREVNSLDLWELIYEVYQVNYENVKNYRLAYYYKDSLMQITDSINDLEKQTAIAEIETKYKTEKKEHENYLLKQEIREQEIESQRQRRMRNFFIGSTIVFLFFVVIITYLFSRLQLRNKQLTRNKEELEKLNITLKKSKEETEKALEFKSLFLANMSHEIRTPLNIIIGFNSILKKKVSKPRLKKYLDSIEMSSFNLLRFLNDILDMSKIEAGKIMLTPDTINLKLLIMNIRELFMIKAQEKNLELSVDFDSKMPGNIIIDEVRLRQILVNLVGNAIKFTDRGFVKVFVDAPVLNTYQSEFSTKINVRIRVQDSGIGISEQDMEQIFESFRQVNLKEQKQIGGTGLGLAISKRLTEMMNGEISVESKKGDGSTFTVVFRDVPVGYSTEEKTGKKTNLSEDLEYEFTGGKILVADDEDMNRSLIKVCFENTAVQVLEAANGEETIELAKKHHPDIIMMDIKMPGLDGLEATKIIKKDASLKNAKIIAFSASNIFDRLNENEIKLFSGLISKPVLLDEMYEQVSKILPHRIKNKSTSEQINLADDLGPLRDDSMAEILEKSGESVEQLKQKWMDVYSTNSMNKILAFSDEIEEFAVNNKLTGLRSYALKIKEAGNKFDIEQVKQLMKAFPELLDIVK